MLPARDATLRSRCALRFERTARACRRPIAVDCLAGLLARKAVSQLLAGRAAIDILHRQIDEILLAEATFRLRARCHRLRQRYGDVSLFACQYLGAVEVATIGNNIETVSAKNGLRLQRDLGQLCAIRSSIGHFVGDDQMMLSVHSNLHVIANNA